MFSDPKENIEQFGLMPGMSVADFGSGSGFYSFELSKVVGETGKVYAVDVQKDLLTKLKNQATHDHLSNIDIIWGDLEKLGGTKLRDYSMDAVMIGTVLFQVEHKDAVVKEVKRILKPSGRVLVVEWKDSDLSFAPKNVLPLQICKELFRREGFVFEKEIRAGEHHYGLIFKKS